MKLLWNSSVSRPIAGNSSNRISPHRRPTSPVSHSHCFDPERSDSGLFRTIRRTSPGILIGAARRLFLFLSLSLSTVAHAQGKVTITGVAVNYDSVKVRFLPVAGAKDYRIYDANVPGTVKYAGVWHLLSPNGYLFQTNSLGATLVPDALVVPVGSVTTPYEADVPGLEIEMNGLTPGIPYTLVVQAVDALGPVAACCQYNTSNAPITTCPAGCPGCRLGMNSCCTKDGKISTNGQGAATNNPNVLASASVTVTPTGAPALPSSSLATQVLFEPFSSGTIAPTGTVNPDAGVEFFTMQTTAATWQIQTQVADTTDTQVFLDNNHFMSVLFDGGTPGTNNPLHFGHSVLALSPTQTADFSGGQILHLTSEIDSHFAPDIRRYADFRLTPANDPYIAFDGTTNQINNTDTDLEVVLELGAVLVTQSTGPITTGDPTSLPNQVAVLGAAGQGIYTDDNRPNLYLGTNGFQNARGLDNRTRFDLFVSTTHFSVYEDGVKISEHDFPSPIPFQQAKVYFAAYHYHDALEVQELTQETPWETYFINTFPSSDERHWDNLGYEVLPANTNWATLAGQIQPPAFLPVAPISNSAAFVGSDMATEGNWLGKYGSDGYNVVNDAINYPSYASVSVFGGGYGAYTWAANTTDVRALEKISVPGERVAACWYRSPSLTFDINLTDGLTHRVGFYCLGFASNNTTPETIQIVDANTGAVLDTETAASYLNGEYLAWNLTGHVQAIVVDPGNTADISGIFFDTPQTTAPVPTNVTLSPTGVTGGTSSTGTVTINGAAPTGGLPVNLSSSDPSTTVPSSVTVAAGSTSATFTATTIPVSAKTKVTITGSANGSSTTATLTVNAPAASSVTLNPISVTGGGSSTGTVTINGAAPEGGFPVSLSSTAGATVPSSVTVAQGSNTATFTATTSATSTTATPSITASANGSSASATLTVTATALTPTGVTFSPSSVTGGVSSTGTVSITTAAPKGGLAVSLSSTSGASVSIPTSVTVAAGKTSVTFKATTVGVATNTTATITATANSVSASGTLTVNGPIPTVLAFTTPPSITPGGTATAKLTISTSAPAGGMTVALSSSGPVTVPGTVTLSAGATAVSFTVTGVPVSANTPATITATANGKSVSATVTVDAPSPTGLTLSPASVLGGSSSTGTVTINGPAPVGGMTVTLSAGSPAAVASSVTVAAGAKTATFTISTSAVSTTSKPTISATCNGVTKSATLTITAATLVSLTFSPTSVVGGTSASLTISLSGPAPTGGAVVTLSSTKATDVTLPAVTIPAGSSSVTVTITTAAVKSSTTVAVTGSYNGTSKSADLTLAP